MGYHIKCGVESPGSCVFLSLKRTEQTPEGAQGARGRCWLGAGVGQGQVLARVRCWPETGVGQEQVVAKGRWWSGAGVG